MKIIKGSFRFAGNDGWRTKEGSYANCFPFFIHRESHENLWSLSHMATGYNVKKCMALKDAKALARYLQAFPLFLVPTLETFTKQLEIHKQKHPRKHAEMLHKITGR